MGMDMLLMSPMRAQLPTQMLLQLLLTQLPMLSMLLVAVAHAVHAPVAHTPVSAAVAPVNYGANKPVNGYGHGQVSHQSVSKPLQGEHRSTTQSKAFGSHAAVVADAPNRLHGAKGVVAHAVHAPVVAHAAAPVAVLG